MTERREERQPEAERRRSDAERRRRIAAAFGDPLPEGTRDESSEAWGERPARGGAGDEEWLRSQVPPHHDG